MRITRYLIEAARALGVQKPKVAVVAPSEQMLPKIQSAVDAAILSKMGDRGQFGNALIDGPLAVDVALVKEVAQTKGLSSPVAGDADCPVVPDAGCGECFL